MKYFIVNLEDTLKLVMAMVIAQIYKIFNKEKIYLIGERKDQCQDNGYHLFKYVRKNHDEDNFYYCIEKDSQQLSKIEELGNIVYYKSFKHFLYYVLAEKLICAHVGSCTPDTPIVWRFEELGLIKKYRVFIQHGITKELIPSLMKNWSNITTFICGAKPEYEFVKKKFGYKEGDVKYLGFCRFDNLHEFKTKKQILIMPTWRQWFGMSGLEEITNKEFTESTYFKAYNSMINSNEFDDLLRRHSYKVIFYPHHEMQRYLHLFETNSKNIIIADKNNYDVQELLKESEILITDYSSIAFDFAYMRKYVIYYQFDQEEYNKHHYSKGYFDYESDGFGPVAHNLNDLINSFENIDKNLNIYIEREREFFFLNDTKNSERHYYEIKSTV